jgi:hypothetical protein
MTPISASLEERDALREKCNELSAYARENWHDPQWRMMMAQALTEAIYKGFETENILDLMSIVERVGDTGRIFMKETRGMRAFWTAKGGYIEASTLQSDVTELVRDMIGFHVYEFEDKLRNNFAETQATLVRLGGQRLDAEIQLRVLRTFQAAVPSSSPYYISGANLSLPALDAAINEVFDETLDGNVLILGRRSMTGQIVDQLTQGGYTNFLPTMNEDFLRRGVIGTYKGATIATLKNFRDDEDTSFFPGNEMYVIGRDASKFGFWGNPLSKEWTDENWYWHYVARQDFGGGVFRPERLRRIVDTSIAP